MQEIKQVKEFSTKNILRQLVAQQMSPTVQNVEKECNRIVNEISSLKEESEIIHRFEKERVTIQNSVKVLQKDMEMSIKNIQQNKTDGEIAQVKTASNINTLREEVLSFQRLLKRREETLENYDKKINGVMQTLCLHQASVDDRIFVIQNKFQGLLSQTLEMTKTVKRDFDNSMNNNQLLKNELLHVIKRAEERQKILDLYINQREEMPIKLFQVHEQIQKCVKKDELETYKTQQNIGMDKKLEDSNKILRKLIPQKIGKNIDGQNMTMMHEMEIKIKKLQILPAQIIKLTHKIQSLAIHGQNKYTELKQETEDMEEKIIEVIDKKLQTIQQNIEHIQHTNNQNQEFFQEKLSKLKHELQTQMQEYYQQQVNQLDQIRSIKTTDGNGQQIIISRQLQSAKKERHKIQEQFKVVRLISQGLNDKLLMFGNKITMFRSDIELFIDNTTKQLKKMMQLKKEQQTHMELVGRILSSFMQSMFILTSCLLQNEKKDDVTSFVTYHDGIVLQFGGESKQLNYRRSHISALDIKQSLLYCLMNLTDQIIKNHNILKWKTSQPSSFFQSIKNNLSCRSKVASRSQSLLIHSPRKRVIKNDDEQDILLDFPLQSKDLPKNNNQSPTIRISNSNLTFMSVQRSSQIKKSYNIKQQKQQNRKQSEERNCFTTSRSHRKAKQSFG